MRNAFVPCNAISKLFYGLLFSFTLIYSQEEVKEYDHDEIARKLAKVNERLEFKRQKQKDFLDEVLILGSSDECLASYTSNNECLLTVGTFNSWVKSYVKMRWDKYLDPTDTTMNVPNLNADSVKELVIVSALKDCYKDEASSKLAENNTISDSIESVFESRVQRLVENAGDSILKLRYSEYFEDYFSEIKHQTYNVLMSTDSLLLDSIIRNKNLNETHLFPSYMYDELTKEMKTIIDSLKNDNWSSIYKTRWGYFSIANAGEVIKRDLVSYEEAKPRLVNLADKKWFKMEVTMEDVWDYYEENENDFRLDDTLTLQIAIVPKVLNKRTGYLDFDLSKRAKINITSIELSESDSKVLKDAQYIKKDTSSHSVELFYGFSHIILNDVKINGRVKPFKYVKNELFETLKNEKYKKIIESAYNSYDEKKRNLQSDILIEKIREKLAPSSDELDNLVEDYKKNGKYKFSSDKQLKNNLKYKIIEQKLTEMTKEWANSEVSFSQKIVLNF